MDAGTFEMIWLMPIDHQYSFPATRRLKKSETAGLLVIDAEKMKKQRNVAKST